MSLLKMLQQAQGGQGLSGLARQFGLDDSQAGGLAEMLAPAIGSAAKKRAESGGLEALLGQLQGEAQGTLFDDPSAAAAPEARAQGENFLEQLLGSRDATKELASEAASRAGVEQSKVEEFLPSLAAMLQGGMQKQTPDDGIAGMLSGLTGGGASSGGGLMGMIGGLLGGSSGGSGGGLDLGSLANMLDADGDGSPLDDILEKVMR
ncbi:MAG: DUF937 domain-containing protein [Paracoccaceae bacterium]